MPRNNNFFAFHVNSNNKKNGTASAINTFTCTDPIFDQSDRVIETGTIALSLSSLICTIPPLLRSFFPVAIIIIISRFGESRVNFSYCPREGLIRLIDQFTVEGKRVARCIGVAVGTRGASFSNGVRCL